MGRKLTISILLVAQLAVPQLCVGGIISHACGCQEETVCQCDTACKHQSGCGHACDCFDDICHTLVLRTEQQDVALLITLTPATIASTIKCDGAYLVTRKIHDPRLKSHDRFNEPYPSGDLPLLI